MDRPCVVRLDIVDLRRAVDDAAFRALVEKGWTVLTSVVVSDEEGQYIQLVMVPPKEVGPTPVALPAWPTQTWMLGVVVGIGAFALYVLLTH